MTDYEVEYQKNLAACGEPFKEFVEFFNSYPQQNAAVLDLGSGQGRDALMIAKMGHRVHGVDLSPTGVAQMLQQAKAAGLLVTGEAANIINFKPKRTFDIVILDRVLHMLSADDDKLAVLQTAVGALKPGGHVLVADTTKNLPMIERFFAGLKSWESVYSKKGFRFFKNIALQ